MSLSTGWVLNRLQGMALPMPDNVVDWVHRMARQQKTNPGLLFGDRNMNSLDEEDIGELSDDEDDEDYIPDDEDDDEGQNGEDEDVSHEYNHDETGSIEEEYDEPMDNDVVDDGMNSHDENNLGRLDDAPGVDESENAGVENAENAENTGVNDIKNLGVDPVDNDIINQEVEDGKSPEEEEDSESTENDKGETVGTDQECAETENESGYILWRNCTRSYKHLFNPEVFDTGNSNDDKQAEVMMTTTNDVPKETAQMSMKKGLKVFGEKGYAAVKKEMQQLHDRKVMQPINRKDLSPAQKRQGLGYLTLLKKKRCGTIKGRGCADGRKQRAYITKEESTSPTISTEAVFLTAIVDAWENHKVVVLDVPGAFMQVDMDKLVHVWFQGEMVDNQLEIDHDLYSSYVSVEKGEKVMYVELLKVLYGTLQAARLIWEKLQAKLVNDWGFTPNQYDSCMVNKKVDGKQLTMAWHMDNLKVSHEKEEVLDEFIGMMEKELGQDAPLSVS